MLAAIQFGCTEAAIDKAAQNEKATPNASVSKELLSALTSGSWVKTTGEPLLEETFVYTFSKDGTYKRIFITDYPVEPEEGHWTMTVDGDRKTHLILKNETERYYWLPRESFIEYDKKTNSLLFSGFNLVDTQKLERPKTK
jgi:hypothetical protein